MVPNLIVDQCVIDKERKISFLVGSVTAKDIQDVIHEKKKITDSERFCKECDATDPLCDGRCVPL